MRRTPARTEASIYYFQKHKLGYFHIPRTGGGSFSDFLIHSLGERGDRAVEVTRDGWHEPIAAKKQVLGDRVFGDSVFLTTVRNPYATVVSLYFWYRRIWEEQHPGHEDYPETEMVATMEFPEYMDWYVQNERTFDDYLLLDGRLPDNVRIAKLERLDSDTDAILNGELHLGLEVHVPRTRHGSRHGPYMSYLVPDDIRRINHMYAWVFENLYPEAMIEP